jgi:cobalt-zinc-cadmium efflux system membrane fusion protein
MFAELEVLTGQTSTAILAIPNSALVEANGKHLVYIQNGNAFQPVEVKLGQTSGDLVEVKSGLFEGDKIVTQRAPQLYAQSLRGGSTKDKSEENSLIQNPESKIQNPLPWWLVGAGGGAIGVAAFLAGAVWSNRRTRSRLVASDPLKYNDFAHQTEDYIDNHKGATLSSAIANDLDLEEPRH